MKGFGIVVAALAGLFLVIALLFGLTWLGIEWDGFFGPKRAAVEREIFRETRSYDEGMIQQLARYRLQHVRAKSSEEKKAIASTVRVMFAEYDPDKLERRDLRVFLQGVNNADGH